MNKTKTLCKIGLVSIALILLLVSSAALAVTENDTGNATIKDDYVPSTALATAEKSASLQTTETKISTSGFAHNPAIYGNKIVWEDRFDGYDIYMYDLSSKKETQITTTGHSGINPVIYGDRIVYSSYGGSEIYMYDLTTNKETQIITSGHGDNPAIYGNRIVWEDYRSGNADIYMYDLSTKKETQITSSPDAQTHPAIYGDRIVWEDDGGDDDGWANHGIYMHDISTNKKMKISATGSAWDPAIYGNKIVWQYQRNGNGDIYMYDLSTKKETQITSSADFQARPAIYGNRIVWEDDGGDDDGWANHGIYMHDISTNKKMKISAGGLAYWPAIYDNKIVWGYSIDAGEENIYMVTVSEPEPIPPVAAFSASPTSGNAPLKVQFTDKSANSPTSWKWSFGDGTYSTDQNPAHTYNKQGKYTISLTVKNAKGSNTVTKSSHINVAAPLKSPVAAFSASPTSGNAPLKVQFTDKSTGTPTKWKWSFGDGTYSTSKNPAHTYSKAGKYTVSLTSSNSAGSNTLKKSGYINVAAPLKAPVAAFSASPRSGKAPLKVQFTDKSANSPTSWKWSFGDGTYSTSKNPAHTYNKAGKYTVKLTVKNAKGSNTKTISGYIVAKK
ncbi:PKD domain-containing protein [Methanosarcina sp. UBA289]|uniref:PKD domain-containing protein n=1 Tax=Methanosarcina sp. UBA289 TaxID=1915574 RepID=UPI0025D9BFF3|nr:PKD domain-containing protein [Methanosarcina sp. UBA289]